MPARNKETVLLVEDEAVLRITFEQFLSEVGCRVIACGTYAEALRALDSEHLDLVITDILLGSSSGVDLLREIQRRGIACEVVMMTGDPQLESATEAVRLGAFDYLTKPVSEYDIKRVCRLALSRRKIAVERDAFRAELEAIFNGVPAGIFTVNSVADIQRANALACEWFDLKPEPANRNIASLPLSDKQSLQKACEAASKNGRTTSDVRIDVPCENGRQRMLVANVVPLVIPGESEPAAAVVMRDITRLIYLEGQVEQQERMHQLVGANRSMREIYRLIQDLAEADSTVLICGESGTGKELIAEAIHKSSTRSAKPMLRVNCSALAEELLESELFGHVRGAFTGAIKDRAGRFEAANGGTLFLDEIGDISPRLQLRLLRALQQGEFERVGDSKTIRVDVRIIAATNQNLTARIDAGQFREDLYYRLNVIRIDVPPLRERIEDLPLLIDHFLRHFNTKFHKEISGISADAMLALMNHRWKGNVRELENCIERAFIVCHEPTIRPVHLPKDILALLLAVPVTASVSIPESDSDSSLDRATLVAALTRTDWNVAKAARKLGIARNTVYEKMKTYNIKRPDS